MVTIKNLPANDGGNKFETTAKHAKYCPECREIKLDSSRHTRKNKKQERHEESARNRYPNCGKSFIFKIRQSEICEECAKKRVYPKNSKGEKEKFRTKRES